MAARNLSILIGTPAAGPSPYRDRRAAIVKNSLDSGLIHKRSILLLHDAGDKQATVAALREIISGYWKVGYSFDRLTPQVVPIVYSYRD